MLSLELLQLIEDHELTRALKWILEKNPSAALPYHNSAHMLRVMWYANMIYKQEMSHFSKSPKALLLAAMFHDFDHSGGFFTDDSLNIKRAISGVSEFIRHEATDATSVKLDLLKAEVTNLIKYTKYPHARIKLKDIEVTYWRSKNLTELYIDILRDADFINYSEQILMNNIIGVKQELFKYDTWKEYTYKTIVFLQSIRYKTEAGRRIGQPLLDNAIDSVKQLYSLCFSESNAQHGSNNS